MGNDKVRQRIKMLLIFGPYVFALASLALCISLFIIIGKQNKQIAELSNDISELRTTQTDEVKEITSARDDLDNINDKISGLRKDVDKVKKEQSQMRNPNEWPKKVYLTFDDGPSPNTEKILDILDEYGVKGNFFVVGTKSDNLKKMYKRIVDEGHVIGMHSYSHKYSEIYVSVDAFTKDLDKISSLVYDETGVLPSIYRFPGGSSNDVSKVAMSELVKVLDERGIVYYDWNISSGDATSPIPTTEEIVDNVLNDIYKNEEAMILFHDLANKTTTVEALPQIIEALLDEGITIAPIDDTTMLIQHNK